MDNFKMDIQEAGWGEWTGLIWPRLGQVAGACAYGNEPSVFT